MKQSLTAKTDQKGRPGVVAEYDETARILLRDASAVQQLGNRLCSGGIAAEKAEQEGRDSDTGKSIEAHERCKQTGKRVGETGADGQG